MKPHRRPVLLKVLPSVPLALFLGCQPLGNRWESSPLVPAGATFRDLQQHTFVESDSEGCFWPSLSPDSQRMAFHLAKQSGRAISEVDIYTKPLNGSTRTQKTFHNGIDGMPAYSPDGANLAFTSSRSGNFDIYITSATSGRAKRQVTSSDLVEIAPSWSRDGTRIAFCRWGATSTDWEIWIFDLETGALTSLVPGLFPRFHPTEDLLVFQRLDKATGRYGIWTIDEAGTEEIEVLSSTETSYLTPSWSPDGTRIVFAEDASTTVDDFLGSRTRASSDDRVADISTRSAADIWVIKRNGTELSQLTAHEAPDWNPIWADSGRIFFVSQRGGQSNIWSVLPEFVELRAAEAREDTEDSPED